MPLHPLYAELARCLPDEAGHALELGCGTGQGCEFFLERGWTVTAIDLDPRAIEATRGRVGSRPGLELIQGDVTEIDLPPADAITAGFLFFLLSPEGFERVWPRVVGALSEGGILLAQFLGPNDDWVKQGALAHTEAEIAGLLRGLDVLHFETVERDGKTAWGEAKHWHVHHVIAQLAPTTIMNV